MTDLPICRKLREPISVRTSAPVNPDGPEAADTIEQLYEALVGYVEFIEPTLNKAIEAGYDNTPHVHLMNAAKDALAHARGDQ